MVTAQTVDACLPLRRTISKAARDSDFNPTYTFINFKTQHLHHTNSPPFYLPPLSPPTPPA